MEPETLSYDAQPVDEDLDAACPDIDAPYEFSSTEMCAQISTDDGPGPIDDGNDGCYDVSIHECDCSIMSEEDCPAPMVWTSGCASCAGGDDGGDESDSATRAVLAAAAVGGDEAREAARRVEELEPELPSLADLLPGFGEVLAGMPSEGMAAASAMDAMGTAAAGVCTGLSTDRRTASFFSGCEIFSTSALHEKNASRVPFRSKAAQSL